MARLFFLEPRLASVVRGEGVVDLVPVALPATANRDSDAEALPWHRLSIPLAPSSVAAVERLWSRHTPELAEVIALGRAVSRWMLQEHGATFQCGKWAVFRYDARAALLE